MKELFILPGEGTPIHSMREDFLFLRGSERNASTDHIVLAGVINLALPINLLDGGGSFASCSFGGTFVETIFLDEGFASFCLPFFGSFSVDC
jgi:hypothetical protein